MSHNKPDPTIQNALAALQSVNPYERFAAIETLARLHYADALDRLIDATEDKHLTVKEAAVWALGDLQDPRANDTLREIIETRQQPMVMKIAALYGLGALALPENVPLLFRVYTGAEGLGLRNAAGRAISRTGVGAIAPLKILYQSPMTPTQEKIHVVMLIGMIRQPEPIHQLIDIALLGRGKLRWAAIHAIGEIGDATPVDMLIQMLSTAPEHALIVLWALENIGEPRGTRAVQRWRQLNRSYSDPNAPLLPPDPPEDL